MTGEACLLCGQDLETFADLCDACAQAFQDLADALDPGNPAVQLHTTPDAVHLIRLEDQ